MKLQANMYALLGQQLVYSGPLELGSQPGGSLAGDLVLSKPESTPTDGILDREEFGFLITEKKPWRRKQRILGTGMLLRNALAEGDILFSGNIAYPPVHDSKDRDVSRASFLFDAEVVATLLRENENDLTTFAILGASALVEVAMLDTPTSGYTKVTEDSRKLANERKMPIVRQYLITTVIYR